MFNVAEKKDFIIIALDDMNSSCEIPEIRKKNRTCHCDFNQFWDQIDRILYSLNEDTKTQIGVVYTPYEIFDLHFRFGMLNLISTFQE